MIGQDTKRKRNDWTRTWLDKTWNTRRRNRKSEYEEREQKNFLWENKIWMQTCFSFVLFALRAFIKHKLIILSYSLTFFFSHSSFQIHPCYNLLLLFICCHVAVQGKIARRWIADKTVNFIYTKWQVKNALKIRILKNPWLVNRSRCWQMFFKISVLKNFGNFTGKHLCWSLFLIKQQVYGQTLKQFVGNSKTPPVAASVLKLNTMSNTRDIVKKFQKRKEQLIESFISSAVSKRKSE